eukprot:scaffold1933_cov112-Isochrysis_galbana.AAC.1
MAKASLPTQPRLAPHQAGLSLCRARTASRDPSMSTSLSLQGWVCPYGMCRPCPPSVLVHSRRQLNLPPN